MKNAIEILEVEFQKSTHYSKYPQDKYPDKKRDIKVLITTSENQKKLAEEYKKAIDILTEHSE